MSAGGSLDLHCESALAYRKLLGRPSTKAGLAAALLASIAANLASPDTDHISGVAWMETLLDVVEAGGAGSDILPIAVQQGGQAKSAQRRVAAVKLLQKLLPKLKAAEFTSPYNTIDGKERRLF